MADAARDALEDGFPENRTFDELRVGEAASLPHTQRGIDLFAAASGDVNPAHVAPAWLAP